jgi:hypothetical protein
MATSKEDLLIITSTWPSTTQLKEQDQQGALENVGTSILQIIWLNEAPP